METTEQIIRRLERQRDEMECILNRRDSYVEMIDWGAMTQEQRDWALYGHTEDLHMELWAIDSRLDSLIPSWWDYD